MWLAPQASPERFFAPIRGLAQGELERRHWAVVEDEERIAGQLNDAVIAHLFRVGLTLHSIRQAPGTSPESTRRLDGAIEELDDAIRALRACVFDGNGESVLTRPPPEPPESSALAQGGRRSRAAAPLLPSGRACQVVGTGRPAAGAT